MDQESTASAFHRFMELPENVHETILSFCDVLTKLRMSETCTHLNRLLFSSPKLIDQIQLSIDRNKIELYLSTIMANQRKYQNLKLKLYHPYLPINRKILKCLKTLSATVKRLTINEGLGYRQLSQIFKIFKNTEKLKVTIFFLYIHAAEGISKTPQLMPNLKELKVSFDISDLSSNQFLKLFEGVNTITRLKFRLHHIEALQMEEIEDFISQQPELKKLSITGFKDSGGRYIRGSALNKAEFLLESLEVMWFHLDRGAVEFFKKQINLKTIKIGTIHSDPDPEAVRAIITLPKLETLAIGDCIKAEDLIVLDGISNPSVLKLNYSGYDSMVLEALISYFPNVTEIMFNLWSLLLTNTPSEKLALMKHYQGDWDTDSFNSVDGLQIFSYQPPSSVITDQNIFENGLAKFLHCHRNISQLVIGHIDWIENNFKLSKEIWLKIACLSRLQTLEFFNPMEITELIRLLGKSKIRKATIYTSAIGIAAVAADGPHKHCLGPWLKIKEV